jgi:Holliday junction resolvasome RuvABC DNA-binding subunit
LKELCKSSKLKVSGTKQQLCERLMITATTTETETETENDNDNDNNDNDNDDDDDDDDNETTSSARMYSGYKQYHLKEILKKITCSIRNEVRTNLTIFIRFEFGTSQSCWCC